MRYEVVENYEGSRILGPNLISTRQNSTFRTFSTTDSTALAKVGENSFEISKLKINP